MNDYTFTNLSAKYADVATAQKSAAEILLTLLDIRENESVLDIGCGSGRITERIATMTKQPVVGVDPSEGMIEQAKLNVKTVEFYRQSAEELDFNGKFDVAFCNSAFQWVIDAPGAIGRIYRALKAGGRIGIQAPATQLYCPNFVKATEAVRSDPATAKTFATFRNPWLFLETAEEYAELFQKEGFEVVFSKIERIESRHTPEEVYEIFASGAIAGYLNRQYYGEKPSEKYMEDFNAIMKREFVKQADDSGKILLAFNRIYLIAKR